MTKTATKPADTYPGAGQLHEVPLDAIEPADDNLRKSLGDLTELTASIKSIGVLEPVVVRHRSAGLYTLIAGHRRLAAAYAAGLQTIPTIYRDDLDEPQRQEAMIVENLLRRDLDPMEEAEGYERLVSLGLSQRAIADRVGFSQSHIAKRLALRKLTDVAQAAVTAGTLTLDVAQELAAAGPAVQAKLSKKIEKGQALDRYSISTAQREIDTVAAQKVGDASGLPKWDNSKHGWLYESNVDRANATHWIISYGTLVWVKGKPRTATPAPENMSAKDAKAAEKARLEQERIAEEKIQRRADRLQLVGMHLDVFLDVACDALLTGTTRVLDEAADDVIRWALVDILDMKIEHPVRANGEANLSEDLWDAWKMQATSTNAKTRRRCFIATVIADLEDSLTGWHSAGGMGLYFRTLTSFGYEATDDEKQLITAWAAERGDSTGISAQPAIDFTNSTIDEPATVWQEPELQPAADVPPAASCSSCSRPATGIDPSTGAPICDACWEQEEADSVTEAPVEPAAPVAGQDFAEIARRQHEQLLAARVAALPAHVREWITEHQVGVLPMPWLFFTTTASHALIEQIDVLVDVDDVCHVIAFEVQRGDVDRRKSVVDAGLARLDVLLPDDDDVRHVAESTGARMYDDEGDGGPLILDRTQEEIAADEAGHRIPPPKPWPTYDTASEERLLKTIAGTTNVTNLTAALDYEPTRKNRARVLEALQLRVAVLTGSMAAS